LPYKNKTDLCEQDNQIAEYYWNELCDAVDKVCAVPSDENFQKMEGLKNKITKFYKAHNKKMEAFEDFEDFEDDSDIIDDIKSQISQKEIEKKLSDKDIASMLEDNIEFNKALVFSNIGDKHGLIEKYIQADEKRLAALKDFIETDDNKKFVVPDIPPFEPYIK
jgi:hypothetical protein